MKRIIFTIWILTIFSFSPNAFANTYSGTIEKLENSLYGFTYNNDSEQERLNRLESSIYGTTSQKTTSERIARLKKDMYTDLIGQEIEPVEDTFADPQDSYYEREPVAASNINYPAVDELEEMVFNKNFPTEDIRKRLSKLEMKIFGKEFNDDLSTRTDRLKAEIKPKSLLDNQIAQSSNEFYDDYIPPLGSDYHLNQYQQTDMFDYNRFNARQQALADSYNANNYSSQNMQSSKLPNISTIEKNILKQSYKNDSTENRLSRIEQAMFGTNFSNEDNSTRLNRISSAYKASKSAAKYDSNKFSQNMTTAVQIGTLLLMVLACIL